MNEQELVLWKLVEDEGGCARCIGLCNQALRSERLTAEAQGPAGCASKAKAKGQPSICLNSLSCAVNMKGIGTHGHV